MVCISEVHEPEDDSTECLNLDDYNSDDFDEYLSDNMETTPPTVTEAQAATKQDPPIPPLAVRVTVQLEEQHAAEDLYEHRRLLNQKRRSGASASPTISKNSKATTMTTLTVTSAM